MYPLIAASLLLALASCSFDASASGFSFDAPPDSDAGANNDTGVDCGGVCVSGTEFCGDNADNDSDGLVDNASCGDKNIILSKFNFSPGENMTPSITFQYTRTTKDWVSHYNLDERNDAIDIVWRSWMYVSENSMTAPSRPGEYELRYYYNDTWGAGGGSATYGESDVLFWVGATCSDGVQNQLEQGVDCDGPCEPCATCSDGTQNHEDTGTHCGEPCAPCAN